MGCCFLSGAWFGRPDRNFFHLQRKYAKTDRDEQEW